MYEGNDIEEEEINDREIDEERNEDIDDERVDEEFYEVMYTCDGNLCINACAKSISGYDPC